MSDFKLVLGLMCVLDKFLQFREKWSIKELIYCGMREKIKLTHWSGLVRAARGFQELYAVHLLMYGALLIATANENAAGERDKENMWSNKHPHFESAHRRIGVFLLVSKGVLTLVSRASKIYCRGIQVHQPPPNLKATETFYIHANALLDRRRCARQ